MYSLYRAWLSLGPPSNLPPLNLGASSQPTAPDVTLHVGPNLTHFSAHKNVLSSHSGFFKAAIGTHTGPGPIVVPNINVDEFSSLLTFMYTGYLDLNITNIYNIILATHLLHMPRALEICRSFLLQTQQIEQPRLNVIKPIASRKTALPFQEIHPPTFSSFQKSDITPFKTIAAEKTEELLPSTSKQTENQIKTPREKIGTKKNNTNKTVVDIACCDGPVRFHRVVNKNYGLPNPISDYKTKEINRNEAMNKVMTDNIRNKQLSDENQGTGELFTCLYCNHTFKSQYCYQKHARRHLNPVSIEAKKASAENGTTKREVKLLDMNVQYYPCKTCGCKFPSYYFVHKHRKLCHAEEMADSTNKNNEITTEACEDSKDSVTIDVETVQQ